MELPAMVKPEGVAERVLRTPMTLPAIDFGEAVKRTQEAREPVYVQGLSR